MCKFKNYSDTFHDKWKYPTKSFGCIASSILPSTSLTPQLNLFPTIIRDISHFSRFYCYYCYYIIHVSPHLPFFQLPTLYSIFTTHFLFLLTYFIYLSAFSYKSNKDASIISIFLALLGMDRREKWPLCSFLSLMIVRTKR